jgi:hypothetical protein
MVDRTIPLAQVRPGMVVAATQGVRTVSGTVRAVGQQTVPTVRWLEIDVSDGEPSVRLQMVGDDDAISVERIDEGE